MKKACSVLMILCVFISLFTGCSFSPLDYIKEKSIDVNPASVIDKTEYTWPQAYSEVLSVCTSRYGEFTEAKGKDDEVVSRTGVFFAGLFDWNSDGTPELFIGSSGKDSKTAGAENFEVYSYINGKAVPVLSEKPGINEGDGEENTVSLIKSDDGNIVGVSHSFNGGKKNDRSFYTFDGEKVTCVKLYFGAVAEDAKVDETAEETTTKEETTTAPEEETTEAETDENGETVSADDAEEAEETQEAETKEQEETTTAPETFKGSYSYFSIDGNECSKGEFNAKLSEYTSMNSVEIDCSAGSDISVLQAFLSGSAAQYTDPYSGIIYASDAKSEN